MYDVSACDPIGHTGDIVLPVGVYTSPLRDCSRHTWRIVLACASAECVASARLSSTHCPIALIITLLSDIDWYQKPPGSCSSHLLNPARDRNMQIRRDPYSLESTRLDPRNRGFTRVARGEHPISERLGINKYGVKWKVIAFVD